MRKSCTKALPPSAKPSNWTRPLFTSLRVDVEDAHGPVDLFSNSWHGNLQLLAELAMARFLIGLLHGDRERGLARAELAIVGRDRPRSTSGAAAR